MTDPETPRHVGRPCVAEAKRLRLGEARLSPGERAIVAAKMGCAPERVNWQTIREWLLGASCGAAPRGAPPPNTAVG